MKLSVIILNYNVRFFLEQTLISVERALRNIDSEIIVIDNASTDGSVEMMRLRFPHIKFIANQENIGFSKANNQAVKEAQGEYICILNPDTAVAEGTFDYCLRHADTRQKLGALGVYLMDGTGNFLPESKRNVPTPVNSVLKLFRLTSRRTAYYALQVSENENGKVPVLPGAFILIKRTVFLEVGGFDEDYFMYGEDIDLSYKLLQAGYHNYYLGSTEILHYKGESTQKDAAYLERFYGAMQIFYKKHFKSNFLLNTLVGVGVILAKKLRKKHIGNTPSTPKIPQQAYLLTENLTLLKSLSEAMEIPLRSASKLILEGGDLKDSLFIFDVDYMPYAQIFMVMKRYRNKNNRFRIRPPGCNFILGSDKSDEKGTVIVF